MTGSSGGMVTDVGMFILFFSNVSPLGIYLLHVLPSFQPEEPSVYYVNIAIVSIILILLLRASDVSFQIFQQLLQSLHLQHISCQSRAIPQLKYQPMN